MLVWGGTSSPRGKIDAAVDTSPIFLSLREKYFIIWRDRCDKNNDHSHNDNNNSNDSNSNYCNNYNDNIMKFIEDNDNGNNYDDANGHVLRTITKRDDT